MSTPEIPDEVVHACARAWCVDPDTVEDCWPELAKEPSFRATVDIAYRAGRESAYTEDEWRVCSGPANKQLPEEFRFPYIFADEIESKEEAVDELAQARDHWRGEDSWIEHRRVGGTEWKRVDDV